MTSSRWRRLALGGLAALFLLYFFLRGVDGHEMASALRSADPRLLAGVALTTVLTYVLRSWRWGYLLAPLVRVGYLRLLSATFVGFMTGLVVPRAGEVVRPYLVARRHPVTTSAAFASIILERLVDLMTMVLLFGAYLYLLPRPAAQVEGSLISTLEWGGALAGLIALAVLGALLALHARAESVLAGLDRVLGRLPARVAQAVRRSVAAFAEGLAVLKAPFPHLLAIAGQSLLVWLSMALGVYLNNRAFGLDLPFHSAFLILGFLTIGVAVPTPGMVGGFHESYLLALTQVFGVDKGTAAAAGITCHALTNLPVLVLGLLFLAQEGLSFGGLTRVAEPPAPETGGGPHLATSVPLGRRP